MKIDIFSDLHLDHWMAKIYRGELASKVLRKFIEAGKSEADTVFFAGDAGNGYPWYELVMKTLAEYYDIVIGTPGNHDFYKSEGNMLANHTTEGFLADYTFLATPLWTNFRNKDGFGRLARRSISDFNQIEALKHHEDIDEPWRIMQRVHKECVADLMEFKPNIAMTHFGPIVQSIHPKYEGDALNTYFCNDLKEEFEAINACVWIHGHTHSQMDYTHLDTRVVAHPIGYPFENYEELIGVRMKTIYV